MIKALVFHTRTYLPDTLLSWSHAVLCDNLGKVSWYQTCRYQYRRSHGVSRCHDTM